MAHDAESIRQAIHAAQVVHDATKPSLTLKTTSHRYCTVPDDLRVGRARARRGPRTLLTYTLLMAMTTIRVEAEVRDRLAALAAAHGRSLGAELQAMLDEVMWQGIEAGYRKLAADREEMAAYQAEIAEWTSANIGDLAATAAEEYPEYNS
jgi:plasmid stability protein